MEFVLSVSSELENATVILISHRLTTLADADLILVLEGGKVAEMGTHEELMRSSVIYKETWLSQRKGGEEDA